MIYTNSNFNGFMEDFFKRPQPQLFKTSTYSSQVNNDEYEINHTKDGAYLFFDAPGFNKTNLKVEMEDGILIIEGKRTYKLNGEDIEKSISKKFKIGSEYNVSSIEATIEDGLLTVFVPNFKKLEKKRVNLL